MISFKQYLTESQFKQAITSEEAFATLEKNCQDALNNRKLRLQPILRATMERNDGTKCFIFHGEAGERKSRHTSNHYTVAFDAALEGFPKRTKSIICGNYANKPHVLNYGAGEGLGGEIYAIFPFDDVKIAVCPDLDIFDTRITILGHTEDANIWNDIFVNFNIADNSFESMVKTIEGISGVLKSRGDKGLFNGFEFAKFADVDVAAELKKAYSNAGIELETTGTARYFTASKPRELWIGGKCVAIPLKLYQESL